MQTSLSFNKPIKTPQMLFGSDNINDFGNRVKSCRMEGDSMQPTIEPCEVVAFVDCGGRVLTPGIYVFTGDVFGRSCLFIKRIEPLPDGSLKIISDNFRYQTFTLDADEQTDIRIHGRVVASLAVRRFV
ncbi:MULTISPECIES: S24 family peptidase [Enterobacter]|uniref:S24 family peptidase n=1 Tax=Enterobacter TaxID=547 RepID=UPI0021C82168|nr:S24 family peptidase [Enterobacter mori]HDC4609883.1 S24 family peptidase [Enterobacter kobei]MCU3988088.1 S24 family peptidase [Enterobacter mori]HDC4625508.1 S24 family peptidase [Enterobacter kobei]HDR2346415.1 S24 family peptidase [Enterobacter kobei]HDR2360819.1 S24 family peptidase [Enterobacter kobei]